MTDRKKYGTRFVVERGSSYSNDPWDIVCICATKEVAEAYIEHECTETSRSTYHISEVTYYPMSYLTNREDFVDEDGAIQRGMWAKMWKG